MTLPHGVRDVQVAHIVDAEYESVVTGLVRGAKLRCLANVFIVDPTPRNDGAQPVYRLLQELQSARWRGVDVRLSIGGSRTNLEIAELSQFGRDVATELGILCIWRTGRSVRGSHAKVVVIDDFVVVGSHNWSGGAFSNQTQDAVVVESAALAASEAARFDAEWDEMQ
jgi:phosphatidylserine/phosphatidylglycerophosphate/cardiolipin synthase-like enzyme